jgi:hypothetical protein
VEEMAKKRGRRESADEAWVRRFMEDSSRRKGPISWKRAPLKGETFAEWYPTRNVLLKKPKGGG